MNVFYPSGSNIETNAFEIKCCQPSNSQNIPRIMRYMRNRKLPPFSKTRYCGALLSKGLYKISPFKNTAVRRSFELTDLHIVHFRDLQHGNAALFRVKNYEYMNKLPGSGVWAPAQTPLPHSPPGKGESGVWARPPTL